MFIRPCKGAITSPFGRDVLNGQERSHFGVDIAQPGTVEIRSAAKGTVSRSYVSTSYGQVVFIVHTINGQEYETVYAHLRDGSRKVSVGDRVEQGELIGLMGNTGYSFGQHLHFELHKGRWNLGKTNAVNPLDYINKESVETVTNSIFSPSNQTLQDSVKRVLTRLSDKPEHEISKEWRKKFEAGEMTDSDALAILYYALDYELIQGSMK